MALVFILHYNRIMKLFALLGCTLLILACDGNGNNACSSGGARTVEEQILCASSPDAPKLVKFILAGTASCTDCDAESFPVAGLYVNVFAADAARNALLDPMATTMTGGLGPFELQVTAEEGTKLRVDAELYRAAEDEDRTNPITMASSTEITVPSDNGDIVPFTLDFPQH